MQDSFSNSIAEKGWTGVSQKKTKILTNPLNKYKDKIDPLFDVESHKDNLDDGLIDTYD